MKPQLALLSLLLALPLSVAGEEWNRFRGHNGNGISTSVGLPDKIQESGRVWRTKVGKGWSSPVVFGSKVFLSTELDGENRGLVCVDLNSGNVLWSYKIPFKSYRQHQFNTFASATPFVDADRVYVQWANGEKMEALALSHEGALVWHRQDLAPYVPEHGSANSAVVEDGVMLIRSEHDGPDNKLLGLEAATGKTLWELPLKSSKSPYSTAMVRKSATGSEFLVVNSVNGVMGVDTKSGKVKWTHNEGGFKQRSVGSCVLDNDQLFTIFGSGGGGKEYAMLKFNQDKPEVAYEMGRGQLPYVPTPLVIGGRLYLLGDGGIFRCLDYKTGEEMYSERIVGADGKSTKYFSSPIYAEGKIYCCSQMGDVVVLKEGKSFEVLSASKLENAEHQPEVINATPAIADGKLVIRSETELHCFTGQNLKLP